MHGVARPCPAWSCRRRRSLSLTRWNRLITASARRSGARPAARCSGVHVAQWTQEPCRRRWMRGNDDEEQGRGDGQSSESGAGGRRNGSRRGPSLLTCCSRVRQARRGAARQHNGADSAAVQYCTERPFRTVRSDRKGTRDGRTASGAAAAIRRLGVGTSATVWVEADRPCTAEVRCADGGGGSAPTFQIAGHHYALVPVTGPAPGTATAYEVLLDGEPGVAARPTRPSRRARSAPPAGPGDERRAGSPSAPAAGRRRPPASTDPVGPDALDTLAARLAADPEAERPDVLLLLGDQVYADETSAGDPRSGSPARRGPGASRPGDQVADYEEYTHLYYESWLDPEIRWLLSTVPSCMIFDDHDVIDDWNTSAAWLADMRATPWWRERIAQRPDVVLGLPAPRATSPPPSSPTDELYAAVRATPDGTDVLRAFAAAADADPASVRWSYRRDFGRDPAADGRHPGRAGPARSGTGRCSTPRRRQWLRDAGARRRPAAYDHLLIGTSLPVAAAAADPRRRGAGTRRCAGASAGPRWARFGEKLRRRGDLEHWAAFPASFEALTELIAEVGTGPRRPGDGVRALRGRAPRVCGRARLDHRAAAALPCLPAHLLAACTTPSPRPIRARIPLRLEPVRPGARPSSSPGTDGSRDRRSAGGARADRGSATS